MPSFAVILPAAGRSYRFRDKHYKKPFAPLGGKAVWLHSAERFLARDDVKQLIVVVADEDREEFDRKFGPNLAIMDIEVCPGGAERVDSIRNALERVRDDIELVAIHDAARPCLADKWIDWVFAAAAKDGAAILAMPVTATLKRIGPTSDGRKDHQIAETVDRQGLWAAQTPQVFRRDLLQQAYAAQVQQEKVPQGKPQHHKPITDDAQLVERLGMPVTVIEGSPLNLKITTRDDLRLAEQVLRVLPKKGMFDV